MAPVEAGERSERGAARAPVFKEPRQMRLSRSKGGARGAAGRVRAGRTGEGAEQQTHLTSLRRAMIHQSGRARAARGVACAAVQGCATKA